MSEVFGSAESSAHTSITGFPALSPFPVLRGGGSMISRSDVVDMNLYLLPRLPVEFRAICANILNFGWQSLSQGTRWHFKRDAQGHIVGAILNDLRDHYTRCWCEVDILEEMMEEAIDWPGADLVFFGCAPEWQTAHLEAIMARHRWNTRLGFEVYVIIALKDYQRFEEARREQTLGAHFKADSLSYPSDSDFVNASWTYKNDSSHITIGESVYSRPSVCIRDPERKGFTSKPETDLINDLVGWEITRSDYTLGSLKVLEAYRSQGLGKWLSAELTAKILSQRPASDLAQIAIYPHPQPLAYVDPSNIPSLKLHEALGYQTGGRLGWARYTREGANVPESAV